MAARVFLGHLPDYRGGAPIAMVCALIEGLALSLVWFAPASGVAVCGALLTGAGYSFVYPALGLEAVKRTAAQSRGLAMGAYTAFLDLALGLAGPSLGLLANWARLDRIFLVSAVVVLGSTAVSYRLLKMPATR